MTMMEMPLPLIVLRFTLAYSEDREKDEGGSQTRPYGRMGLSIHPSPWDVSSLRSSSMTRGVGTLTSPTKVGVLSRQGRGEIKKG